MNCVCTMPHLCPMYHYYKRVFKCVCDIRLDQLDTYCPYGFIHRSLLQYYIYWSCHNHNQEAAVLSTLPPCYVTSHYKRASCFIQFRKLATIAIYLATTNSSLGSRSTQPTGSSWWLLHLLLFFLQLPLFILHGPIPITLKNKFLR